MQISRNFKNHISLKSNWEMGVQNGIYSAYNLTIMDLFFELSFLTTHIKSPLEKSHTFDAMHYIGYA